MGEVYTITAKFGTLALEPTSATRIIAKTADDTFWSYRGVEYSVRFDLYQWLDGHFHIGEEANSGYERRAYAMSIQRKDWLTRGCNSEGASGPTMKLFAECAQVFVDAWAKQNIKALLTAEVANKDKAFDRACKECSKAFNDYERAKEAKNRAYAEYNQAKDNLEDIRRITDQCKT